MSEPLPLFPLFLKLAGRRVLLVGAGRVAAAKLPALLSAGAQVAVVAPEVRPEFEQAGVEVWRRALRALGRGRRVARGRGGPAGGQPRGRAGRVEPSASS